ncbi:Nif3-like dinuclear metal center hexameric protein [Pantoea sp. Aalb]|uniref:Nif3-like dinuclear metal center hexameric protein n=1 Tax=Pantoea sp. Aalb TaxID=2576762 RepID=UPI001326CC3C|nr:Nif3-like dinuclear metal center hexameric protein [Pantoea sp. Aalb]MXP67540.1 Nif3-like dinuclear metal center hexameric protein [Pantoea sp. Aalb]
MNNIELEEIVNKKLNTNNFNDYIPNGLQVEGRNKIKNIITGVTACQLLINEAINIKADAIIVHHGFFWKNELPFIKGIKRQRLRSLLENNINLYSWHLPLDAHPDLGNNVQLGHILNINIKGNILPLVLWGEFKTPINGRALFKKIEKYLGRTPLHCNDNAPEFIKKIAWSTGKGQCFIDEAALFGVDAFITGEVSEQTIHSARELKIHFFAIGHHASERGGVKALGEWLALNYKLNITFIDIYNPI